MGAMLQWYHIYLQAVFSDAKIAEKNPKKNPEKKKKTQKNHHVDVESLTPFA